MFSSACEAYASLYECPRKSSRGLRRAAGADGFGNLRRRVRAPKGGAPFMLPAYCRQHNPLSRHDDGERETAWRRRPSAEGLRRRRCALAWSRWGSRRRRWRRATPRRARTRLRRTTLQRAFPRRKRARLQPTGSRRARGRLLDPIPSSLHRSRIRIRRLTTSRRARTCRTFPARCSRGTMPAGRSPWRASRGSAPTPTRSHPEPMCSRLCCRRATRSRPARGCPR